MAEQFEKIIPVLIIVFFIFQFLRIFMSKKNAARKEEPIPSGTPVRKPKKVRKTPPPPLVKPAIHEEIQPDLTRNMENYKKNEESGKFPENLSRFSLLQQAFVLQELFGEPKGLKEEKN